MNVLGGSVTVRPDGTLHAIVRWSAREQAAVIVIATQIPAGRAFVRVQWSVGGAFAEAEVDIGRGIQLGVLGDNVLVDGGVNHDPKLSADVSINASIAFADAAWLDEANRLPATRTRFFDALAAGEAQTAKIPAFARTMTVHDAIDVDLLDAGGNVLATLSVDKDEIGMDDLDLGMFRAASIRVTNRGAIAIDARVVFGIKLPAFRATP